MSNDPEVVQYCFFTENIGITLTFEEGSLFIVESNAKLPLIEKCTDTAHEASASMMKLEQPSSTQMKNDLQKTTGQQSLPEDEEAVVVEPGGSFREMAFSSSDTPGSPNTIIISKGAADSSMHTASPYEAAPRVKEDTCPFLDTAVSDTSLRPTEVVKTTDSDKVLSTSTPVENAPETPLVGSISSPDAVKLMVSSDLYFGPGIKKVLRLDALADRPGTQLRHLKNKLVSAFSLPVELSAEEEYDRLLLFYFDEDVSDFVLLEDASWVELLSQSKKHICISHLDADSPPMPPGATHTPPIPTANPDRVGTERKSSSSGTEDSASIPTQLFKEAEADPERVVPEAKPSPSIIPQIKTENLGPVASVEKSSVYTFPASLHASKAQALVSGRDQMFRSLWRGPRGDSLPDLSTLLKTFGPVGSPVGALWPHGVWRLASGAPAVGSVVVRVNGVLLSGLDQGYQYLLARQTQRPLILEVSRDPRRLSAASLPLTARSRSESGSVSLRPSAPVAELKEEAVSEGEPGIPYSLFLAKYSHNATAKLRKQTDRLLTDYVECDWAAAKSEGTGLPQTTLVSLYRFLEQEMVKLDLFSSKKTRGVGAPTVMTEKHWEDLREHIESYVFRRVGSFTKNLWPIYREHRSEYQNFDEQDELGRQEPPFPSTLPTDAQHDPHRDPYKGIPTSVGSVIDPDLNVVRLPNPIGSVRPPVTDLSPHHSIHMKLAFLRFLSLHHLGLTFTSGSKKGPSGLGLISETPVSPGSSPFKVGLSLRDSGTFEPNQAEPEVSPPLPSVGSLSADEIRCTIKRINEVNVRLASQEEWYQAMRGFCQAVLIFDTPGEILVHLKQACKLVSHALHALLSESPESRGDLQCDCCGLLHLRDEQGGTVRDSDKDSSSAQTLVASLCRDATAPSDTGSQKQAEAQSSDSHYSKRHKQLELSADELLPAITWVLLQSNPPNIEYVLWLCSEFRHPALLRGEDAYCLAQLSSALEFLRSARLGSFDLSPQLYSAFLLRYNHTLKLLLACKHGELETVRALVQQGADVNGLSPDHRDCPLTACIRFHQPEVLQFLLQCEDIEVDNLVHLYHGRRQRSTPLLVATQGGQLGTVLALLGAGARRHLADDDGNTPLSLAGDENRRQPVLKAVLTADPLIHDLLTAAREGDEALVAGLLLQGVEVDFLLEPEQSVSPLIAAVEAQQVAVVRLLLSRRLADLHVDLRNRKGETALIVCAKQCLERPTEQLVVIAAMLLRAGADRGLQDLSGTDALSWVKRFKTVASVQELMQDVKNPFIGGSEQTSNEAQLKQELQRALALEESEEVVRQMRVLLQYDSSQDFLRIYELSRNKDHRGVKALLLQGVDPNQTCPTKGYSALIAAVYNRDLDMVELLLSAHSLQKSSNPTCKTLLGTPFSEIAASGVRVGLGTKLPSRGAHPLQLDQAGRGGMRALHFAAQLGDTTAVGMLLKAGAQRDSVNDKQHTPLDVAVANGHVEAANALRFDPQKVSICLAAKHGDWLVMRALMAQGISINTQKPHVSAAGYHHELYTPLIAATAHGQTETIRQILALNQQAEGEAKSPVEGTVGSPLAKRTKAQDGSPVGLMRERVDVNLSNLLGQTALIYAAARGDEATVLKLLAMGADRKKKDVAGHDAAHWADDRGFPALAILLRHDPAEVYIHDAIRRGNFAAVVALFKQNVSPNMRRTSLEVSAADLRTPLTPSEASSAAGVKQSGAAGKKGQFDPATELGVGVVRRANEAFRAKEASAVSGGNAAALAELYQLENATFIPGETPLTVAARCNRMEVVSLLLKAPEILVNLPDGLGWTPLFHAAAFGREEVVLTLLKHGAARFLKDRHGRTAVQVSEGLGKLGMAALIEADPYYVHIQDMCEWGRVRMVVALLKQGCPPTFRDERVGKMRQTPLMAAATGGQAEVVKLLLNNEAVLEAIDEVDARGRTALMRAAAVGALDVTGLLLNAGSDRTVKDYDGLTARDHASRHSYKVMFQFMGQTMVR